MRILFFSPHHLLDDGSGAARSMRTLLDALAARGHEVRSLTGNLYDGPERAAGLPANPKMRDSVEPRHAVVEFASTRMLRLRADEEAALFARWRRLVETWRPDAVLSFGGFLCTRLVFAEARAQGIRTVFYLAADGYRDSGAFDDADRILAVSAAIAARAGLVGDPRVRVISSLLQLDDYRVSYREPRYVVFVNPQAAKGLAVFAALAQRSERLGRPHRFLVVESRGTWAAAVAALPALARLGNVTVWPRRDDMREVYAVAHTVIFPSLWFEAAGRVLREAGINGIPVVAHRVGGVEETVPEGLVLLEPPAALLDDWMAPVPEAFAASWLAALDRLAEDQAWYAQCSERIRASVARYSLEALVSRVDEALTDGFGEVLTGGGERAVGPAAAADTPEGAHEASSTEPVAGGGGARRILFVASACVLDRHSAAAGQLRALLEGLASRGNEVRVLCGSVLQSENGGALLERTPVSGRWTGGAAGPQGLVRGGTLRGVRYRVLCFGSSRAERLLAKEAQALFLAYLDIGRAWAPQVLIAGGDDLFAELLRRRAAARALPTLRWPMEGGAPVDPASVMTLLALAPPSG